MNFFFTAPDISKIRIALVSDGNARIYTAEDFEEYSEGVYMVGSNNLFATDFEDVYTAVLLCDNVAVQTLTYSVRSYVYAKQNGMAGEELSNMARLARALWCYGESAVAYVNAAATGSGTEEDPALKNA